MKKIIMVVICFFSLILISSCRFNQSSKFGWEYEKYQQDIFLDESIKKDLVEDGKLIIGTSPDYQPYEFIDAKKNGNYQFQGSDIYFGNYLASRLGLSLEIRQSEFDGLLTNLSLGKVDIVLSGLTYSTEREKNFTFTDEYYNEKMDLIITKRENKDKFDTKLEINDPKVKIGVQSGSTQQTLANNELPNAYFVPFSKIDQGIILLNENKVDVLVLSYYNAEILIQKDKNIVSIDGIFDSSIRIGTSGLTRKESKLLSKINEIIQTMPKDLYQKWVNTSIEYAKSLDVVDDSNFFTKIGSILQNYSLEFLKGTGITIALSIITVIFGTIIAFGLVFLKKIRFKPIKFISNAYVEVVRGVPLLLLLWLIYIITPSAWPAYISISIALFLNSGAYVTEIIRAGLVAVDKGQYEAARSLGLSKFRTYQKIIIPQAIKKILPALCNEFITLIKETSLASLFFIGDLMTIKNNITSITYLSIEPLIIVGIIYFILTFSASRFVKILEKRMKG